MKILTMIEDGKITADEGVKLLAAVQPPVFNEMDCGTMEEKFNRFAQSVESFSKEVSAKAVEAYKGVEPKLKKVSRSVVEKTAALADDLSKSLRESLNNLQDEINTDNCGCGCGCQSDSTAENSPQDSNDISRQN